MVHVKIYFVLEHTTLSWLNYYLICYHKSVYKVRNIWILSLVIEVKIYHIYSRFIINNKKIFKKNKIGYHVKFNDEIKVNKKFKESWQYESLKATTKRLKNEDSDTDLDLDLDLDWFMIITNFFFL